MTGVSIAVSVTRYSYPVGPALSTAGPGQEKEADPVSNMPEIKRRVKNLTRLGNTIKDQLTGLGGPEGEGTRKKAVKEGTRLGIGAGVSILGASLAAVAMVYSLGVVILLLNLAINRIWLSALIVVCCFLLLGGAVLAIGVELAKRSAKNLSRAGEDAKSQLKATGEEMKSEVDELQKIISLESKERQKQAAELVESAKKAAPVAAPAVAGAYVLYRVAKRRARSRRKKRAILGVIETYEESRARD